MGNFIDELSAGLLNEDERPEACDCAHMKKCPNFKTENFSNKDDTGYDDGLDDLLRAIKPFTRGGLIKLTDLERLIPQLKEEGALNEAHVGE